MKRYDINGSGIADHVGVKYYIADEADAEIEGLKKENSDLHVRYEAMSEVNTELVEDLKEAQHDLILLKAKHKGEKI